MKRRGLLDPVRALRRLLLPGRWPACSRSTCLLGSRAVGAVERDADAPRRRRSGRGRAGRRRRLPERRRTPTVRAIVDNLRKAKVDERVSAVLLEADRLRRRRTGERFRSARRRARLQEVGQTGLRLSRIRRRSRLLPGERRRQGLPDAVEPARSHRRRDLPAVPARHARQGRRRIPDLHHIGEYKTGVNTFTEKGYTPAHREMDVSLNRDLYDQIVRGIADGRKKTEAEVRADRRRAVHCRRTRSAPAWSTMSRTRIR